MYLHFVLCCCVLDKSRGACHCCTFSCVLLQLLFVEVLAPYFLSPAPSSCVGVLLYLVALEAG